MGKLVDRTGEMSKNTFGTEMRIVKYNNSREVIVQFQDKYKYEVNTTYDL